MGKAQNFLTAPRIRPTYFTISATVWNGRMSSFDSLQIAVYSCFCYRWVLWRSVVIYLLRIYLPVFISTKLTGCRNEATIRMFTLLQIYDKCIMMGTILVLGPGGPRAGTVWTELIQGYIQSSTFPKTQVRPTAAHISSFYRLIVRSESLDFEKKMVTEIELAWV